MVSTRMLASRIALCLVATVAVAALGGCSSSSPSAPAATEAGSVTGTVRSEAGEPLSEITLWLYATLGDGTDMSYQAVTDGNGQYDFEDVEMETAQASVTSYEICANRTPARTDPLNGQYESWASTVAVQSGETAVVDVELGFAGGYDQESYEGD